MKRIALLLFCLLTASAEASTRDVKIDIMNATVGDTYQILAAPQGQPVRGVGRSTLTMPQVIVTGLTVGATYDFAAIVWRGNLRSVRSPVLLHYRITTSFNQRLLGVSQ